MVLILLGSTFLIYILTAFSGDPLEDLRLSTEENAQYLIEQLTKDLQLDIPPPIRYFLGLEGVLGFLWGDFTLGVGLDGAPVLTALSLALPVSIRLVITATILCCWPRNHHFNLQWMVTPRLVAPPSSLV
jgi:peptide/nickel transport system permease protein